MVDTEITRKENLEPLGANPDIPSFLVGEHQPSRKAKLRIHVERAIQRVKYLQQIRNEILLMMHGSINRV